MTVINTQLFHNVRTIFWYPPATVELEIIPNDAVCRVVMIQGITRLILSDKFPHRVFITPQCFLYELDRAAKVRTYNNNLLIPSSVDPPENTTTVSWIM